MHPINELITREFLEDLATRSNFRYGKNIAKDADFEFEKINTFNIIAKIKNHGHETRTVELMSTTKGFRWKCSCSSRKDLFCEHCVAVGLKHLELAAQPEEP
jgi:uncharacterized Zn finger protein